MKFALYLTCMFVFTTAFGQNWDLSQKVVPLDRRNYDHFGNKVAKSGDYVIVGARYNDYDENGQNYAVNAGAAYVYKKSVNGSWNLFQKLVAKDRSKTDYFGYDVNIQGSRIIVSAVGESKDKYGDTLTAAGAVYIFSYSDSLNKWVQEDKIFSNARHKLDYFGWSTAIYKDYAVVGKLSEHYDENEKNYLRRAGAAYVYKRDSFGRWKQIQKIVPKDRDSLAIFGYDVDIYENQIIIGSYGNKTDASGGLPLPYAGAAYIYKLDKDIWKEDHKIVASDRSRYSYFGISVKMDSNYTVLGAYADDYDVKGKNYIVNSGAAYVFNQKNKKWVEKQKIVASDRERAGYFGYSVDVSGTTISVGSIGNTTDDNLNNSLKLAGAAYVFELNSTNSFEETNKLVSRDRDSNQRFGYSVAVSKKYAVMGSYLDSKNSFSNGYNPGAGAAYFFENCKTFSELKIDACSDYVSPSKKFTWNKTGKYTDIIPNENGCDSVITIYLNMIQPSYDTINPVVCHYYLTPNGNKLTHSGIYSEIVKTENGCNNLLTINLKIINNTNTYVKTNSCIDYISPSGKYLWNKDGIYMDTLISAEGCDSVLTIDLKIHHPTYATHHISACKSFNSYSNNQTWFKSGVYKDTALNRMGCDSFLSIDLTINKADVDIIYIENQLIAKSESGFYQWMECIDHGRKSNIKGENNRLFLPPKNGAYALALSDNGCTDTSNCYYLFDVNLTSVKEESFAKVHPNPHSSTFNISLKNYLEVSKIELIDCLGKSILVRNILTSNELTFDNSGSNGIYFLRLSYKTGKIEHIKVVKN